MPKGVYIRKPVTDEHKRNISIALIGHKAWNKGKIGYINAGSFKKGNHPKTEFKKGRVSWSKGKKLPQFSGENSPSWKGGKTIGDRGYIFIYQPNHPFVDNKGYVREHRLVIEKQVGRYLTHKEIVHHLGKKDDNRPCMLMAFINHSAHIRFERKAKVKPEEIIFDGRLL